MSKKTKKTATSDGQSPRPWRDVSTFAGGPGQVWTGYASWVILVAIVAVAAAIVFWPKPTPAGAPEPAAASSPSSRESPAEGVCDESPEDSDARMPPADLEWVSVHGNSWPVSDSTGPKKDVNGVTQCFDRSPVGAALAAVNAIQSFRTADLDEALQIIDARFVDNAGRDKTIAGVMKAYPDQPAAGRPWGRVIGYTVMAFAGDTAKIMLIEDWPGRGQYTGFTVTLQWTGGDWRVELLDSGQPHPDYEPITVDPNAFTPWADARS